jgi:molybdate transport system substrate-binding protein
MNIRSLGAAATIGFIFLLVIASAAASAELKVLYANGMQTVMEDLGPKFERATGHKLALTFATGGATVKRARDGESVDVVIAIRQGDRWLGEGGQGCCG